MDEAPLIYTVCNCPCDGGPVVALKASDTGKPVYFAPCCGIAWPEAPLHGRLDVLLSFEDIAPAGVLVATLADLRAGGMQGHVTGTEPLERWRDDIPSLQIRPLP